MIDRLDKALLCGKHPFYYPKSIANIPNFFLHCDLAYLGSDIEFDRWLMAKKIVRRHRERVNQAYDHFLDMYVNQFYDNNREMGQDVCYKYEFMIKRFLEKRICEIVDIRNTNNSEREMHGYSLVEERSDRGINIPPLLSRYLNWLCVKPDNEKSYLLTHICDEAVWIDFIKTHMQIEIGLHDFYKVKRRNK